MSRQRPPPGQPGPTEVTRGDGIDCGTVQITAREILEFAAISGDRFDIHLSDAAAQAQGFPRQVAHGLLVAARAEGLLHHAPAQGAATYSGGWTWHFRHPVFAGDRITLRYSLAELVLSDAAVAEPSLTVEIHNQDGILVQTGETRARAAR